MCGPEPRAEPHSCGSQDQPAACRQAGEHQVLRQHQTKQRLGFRPSARRTPNSCRRASLRTSTSVATLVAASSDIPAGSPTRDARATRQHDMRFAVKTDSSTDNRGISLEVPAPEAPREHHDTYLVRPVVMFDETPGRAPRVSQAHRRTRGSRGQTRTAWGRSPVSRSRPNGSTAATCSSVRTVVGVPGNSVGVRARGETPDGSTRRSS